MLGESVSLIYYPRPTTIRHWIKWRLVIDVIYPHRFIHFDVCSPSQYSNRDHRRFIGPSLIRDGCLGISLRGIQDLRFVRDRKWVLSTSLGNRVVDLLCQRTSRQIVDVRNILREVI